MQGSTSTSFGGRTHEATTTAEVSTTGLDRASLPASELTPPIQIILNVNSGHELAPVVRRLLHSLREQNELTPVGQQWQEFGQDERSLNARDASANFQSRLEHLPSIGSGSSTGLAMTSAERPVRRVLIDLDRNGNIVEEKSWDLASSLEDPHSSTANTHRSLLQSSPLTHSVSRDPTTNGEASAVSSTNSSSRVSGLSAVPLADLMSSRRSDTASSTTSSTPQSRGLEPDASGAGSASYSQVTRQVHRW